MLTARTEAGTAASAIPVAGEVRTASLDVGVPGGWAAGSGSGAGLGAGSGVGAELGLDLARRGWIRIGVELDRGVRRYEQSSINDLVKFHCWRPSGPLVTNYDHRYQ